MALYISIPLFIVSLLVIIKGGDIFVDAASEIAKKSKIPSIIIGATIVSIATTMPELIVGSIASIKGTFDLAVGNAIGSVICNTALILGVSITFAPTVLKRKTSNIKSFLLLGVIILCFVFCLGIEQGRLEGVVNWAEGILLLAVFALFIYINVVEAKRENESRLEYEDLFGKEAAAEMFGEEGITEVKTKMSKLIFIFLLGAAMVGASAYGLVESATAIAYSLHISNAVVGFTIVAIGTSLPELVTTINSLQHHDTALGYGNIIGANIGNMALILGTCACISGNNSLPMNPWTVAVSFPAALFMTMIFVIPLAIKQRTYRWQGIVLLLSYVAYLAFILIMTLNGITI